MSPGGGPDWRARAKAKHNASVKQQQHRVAKPHSAERNTANQRHQTWPLAVRTKHHSATSPAPVLS
jgi:hypothetical protein